MSTSDTPRTVVGHADEHFIARLRACFGESVAAEVEQRTARDDLLVEVAETVDTAAALGLLERQFAQLDRRDQ